MRLGIPYLFLISNIASDVFCTGAAFFLAYFLRFESGLWPVFHHPPMEPYGKLYLALLPVQLLVFQYVGLYRRRRGISGTDEFSKIVSGVFLTFAVASAATFFWRDFSYSRLVMVSAAGLAVLLIWAVRMVLRRLQIELRRRGIGLTRLLVVGTKEAAWTFLHRLRRDPSLGYQVVGVVGERKDSPKTVEQYPVVGEMKDLLKIIDRKKPEEVLFALPAEEHARLIPLLISLQDSPVRYKIISDLFGIITNPMKIDVLMGLPVFEMKEAPLRKRYNRFLKRTFDLCFSALGLTLLTILPVFPLIALGVKLSSPGPVFFRQRRVGRDGKVFEMLKFRTMYQGSETLGFTKPDDPRRTRFGVFLRKTSLDELPQLWNVFVGEMSLVGPRPEVPGLVEKFERTIPRYFERHQVKAGITGWAQVNGLRGNTPLEERVKYDIYYIENWSLWFDIRIILQTIWNLFEHRHAY